MINRTHLIESQVVEVAFPENTQGQELLQKLTDLVREVLLPQLEALMNEHEKAGYIIRLESIDLDLGQLSFEHWQEEFVERTKKKMQEEILQQISIRVVSEARPEGQHLAMVSGEVPFRIISVEDNIMQLFLEFLQTGILKVSAPFESHGNFEAELLKVIKYKFPQLYFSQLQNLLSHSETALQRLIMQFSDNTLSEIINLWDSPSFTKEFIAVEEEISKRVSAGRVRRLLIWAIRFHQKLLKEESETSYQSQSQSQSLSTAAIKLVQRLIQNQNFEIRQDYKFIQMLPPFAGSGEAEKPERLAAEQSFSSPVFVSNAGLVLLHPFLPAFFRNLGYCDDKMWLNEDLHEKAVLMSQYLVSGSVEIAEYDLLLNKIICGFPLNVPVASRIDISENEITEAEDLLNSVVKYWQALKSTSPDALRSTFLQRNAKLSFESRGWLLQVENKTWDVLMDKLPWGISLIKNDFMKEWLYVEWN